MSQNQLHCPKCSKFLQIEIDKTNLDLYCKCGYTNTHTIREYLHTFQKNQSLNDTALPDEIKEIHKNLQA